MIMASPKTYISLTLTMALLSHCTGETVHTVGDSMGWIVPSEPYVYTNWTRFRNFTVGDILLFKYDSDFNNVVEVSRTEYETCNISNVRIQNPAAIVATTNGLPHAAAIPLREARAYYFACTLGHNCAIGEKLAINVTAPLPLPGVASPSPAPGPGVTRVDPPSTVIVKPPVAGGSIGSPVIPKSSGSYDSKFGWGRYILPMAIWIVFWRVMR